MCSIMENPVVNRLPHQTSSKRSIMNSKQLKKSNVKNIPDFDDGYCRKYHGYYGDVEDGHVGYQYNYPSNFHIPVPIKADIPDRVMISSRVSGMNKASSPGLSPIRSYDPREFCHMPRICMNSPPLSSYHSKSSPVRSITSLDRWGSLESTDDGSTTAVVTSMGIISLMIHHDIRVDITVDAAIRILNFAAGITISVSATGKQCAFLHPIGRMRLCDNKIEIVGISPSGNHKFAKIWNSGISFTSERSVLVYLVDPAGTRSTKDIFSDLLATDFSKQTFLHGSQHGSRYLDECVRILSSAHYKMKADGSEIWIINDILIQKTVDNLVSVNRGKNEIQIKTNLYGKARLTTPVFHSTASSGEQQHLFVKSDDKRMHYDGSKFVVRNAAQSAGFNNDLEKLSLF